MICPTPSYGLTAPPRPKKAILKKSAGPHSEELQFQRTSLLWGRPRIRKSVRTEPCNHANHVRWATMRQHDWPPMFGHVCRTEWCATVGARRGHCTDDRRGNAQAAWSSPLGRGGQYIWTREHVAPRIVGQNCASGHPSRERIFDQGHHLKIAVAPNIF